MTKLYLVPNPLDFEGIGLCFWDPIHEFRAPKKGEYYVSGAIPACYKARADLESPYWIVKPSHMARKVFTYERGAAVVLPGDPSAAILADLGRGSMTLGEVCQKFKLSHNDVRAMVDSGRLRMVDDAERGCLVVMRGDQPNG